MRKSISVILVVFSIALVQLGCTQSSSEKPTRDAKTEFEVTTKDTPISEESLQNAKFISQLQTGDTVAASTTDIFHLSESFMKLAELERGAEQTYLPYFGHRIVQEFYSTPANFTAFRANEAPYVEVAVAVKENAPPGERLTDLVRDSYTDAAACIREKILKIEAPDFPEYSSRKSGFWDKSIYSNYDLSPYFSAIKIFLERVQFHITEDSGMTRQAPCVPMALAQALRDTVQKEFLPQIEQLNAHFDNVNDDMRPEEILDAIEEGYTAVEMFKGTPVIDEIKAIVAQGRIDVRNGWNRAADVLWFTNLKHEVLEKHANALIEYVNDLGPLISDTVEYALLARVSPENIIDELFVIGEGEVQKRFFEDNDFRPAVERSNTRLVISNKGLSTAVGAGSSTNSRQESPSSVVTSGETIGASVNLLAQRVKSMESLEGLNTHSTDFQYPLFTHFNKMVRAVGHYDSKGISEGAFYRPMSPGLDAPFDIYHYHEASSESAYYGIPDLFRVEAPFSIVPDSVGPDSRVTVASISEWIRGASQMMNFVNPSKGGIFNETLALHVYAEQFKVFPRESLFDLHLALAATHLLNLLRDGVSIINRQGEALRVQEIDDLSTYPGLMAAPHDVVFGGRTDEVRSKDIGKLMVAIAEFLNVTSDLPDGITGSFRTNWNGSFQELLDRELGDLGRNLGVNYSCGNPEKRIGIESVYENLGKEVSEKAIEYLDCKNRREVSENYQLLQDANDKLKILLFGLGFYLASEIQLPEGGFYSIGEVGNRGALQGYDLESQIHVMRGLVAAYEQGWQGKLFKFLIADAYHKLNSSLYNEDLGFYQVSSEKAEMPSLRVVAETLVVLHEIESFVPESSRDQLQRNRFYWSRKLSEEFKELYSFAE